MVMEITHALRQGLRYTHLLHVPVINSPFDIRFIPVSLDTSIFQRINHMFRIVRLSSNPSRISYWRLVMTEAPKAFYSTLKQEMTLPKYKYIDVSLSRAKVVGLLNLTCVRTGRH